jgi:hypothetical protein
MRVPPLPTGNVNEATMGLVVPPPDPPHPLRAIREAINPQKYDARRAIELHYTGEFGRRVISQKGRVYSNK